MACIGCGKKAGKKVNMEIENGIRVFHLGINFRNQQSLCAALCGLGPYVGLDWREWLTALKNKDAVHEKILYMVQRHKPEFIFAQIQSIDFFTKNHIQRIVDESATGVRFLNWSGDIRPEYMQWYCDIAQILNVCSGFSDTDSVQAVRDSGECARLVPIGYEESIFNPYGNQESGGEIVFTGTIYEHFPLFRPRIEMAQAIFKKYKGRFRIYGGGNWKMHLSQYVSWIRPVMDFEQTARIYRAANIVIGMNNYNIQNYTSDRMFNAVACGTLYLAQYFEGIEDFYTDGEHIAVWKTIPELMEKLDFYLSNSIERNRIAKNGAAYTLENHTWRCRMKEIKKWLEI